jgi:hypothetical protein
LKLKRADEHLAFLDEALRGHIGDEERPILGYFDSDASEYVFRVDVEPPPEDWGTRVGEFAHNLRSALDNLVWQLALLGGGTPDKSTQFPIFEDEVEWNSGKRRSQTRALRPHYVARLKPAQPFHLGENIALHPLAILTHLNNLDKHRAVHVGFVWLPDGRPFFWANTPWVGVWKTLKPLRKTTEITFGDDIESVDALLMSDMYDPDDRTEVLRIRLKPSGPNPEVKVEPSFPPAITFSDRQRPVLLHELQAVRRFVEAIFEEFEPDFG